MSHLQQQQADRQTPHQRHVGSGPSHDLLKTADGENALSCCTFIQRLHPEAAHGVQNRLQMDTQVRHTGQRAQHAAPGRSGSEAGGGDFRSPGGRPEQLRCSCGP